MCFSGTGSKRIINIQLKITAKHLQFLLSLRERNRVEVLFRSTPQIRQAKKAVLIGNGKECRCRKIIPKAENFLQRHSHDSSRQPVQRLHNLESTAGLEFDQKGGRAVVVDVVMVLAVVVVATEACCVV